MFEMNGKFTSAKIMIDEIDAECKSQIITFLNHSAFTNPIAIMPDTHSGKGSVIGFTMKLGEKVIPNVIGVDIGCGMLSFNLPGIKELDHSSLDRNIRSEIPFGKNIRQSIHPYVLTYIKEKNIDHTFFGKYFNELCKRIGIDKDYSINSIGTLGGGNHFIEIGRSNKTNELWVTIHTGSRHLGKKICEYWQNIASKKQLPDFSEIINEIKVKYPKQEWNKYIIKAKEEQKRYKKSNLDWLDGEEAKKYLKDMQYAQLYADLNRYTIFKTIVSMIPTKQEEITNITTIHNFMDFRDLIIRKGAIRSYIGEKMIIPLNMRDGILVCEGKSNPEWNFSAPHGAGRLLSRSKAKEKLKLDEFQETMNGIFSTSVNKYTLDEAPGAYKDSTLIELLIEPTANIIDKIIPIHNLKDSSDTIREE